MNATNQEVRKAIEAKRLKHWEVAALVGIDPSTFSRWLRVELSPERKKKVLKAIHNIKI